MCLSAQKIQISKETRNLLMELTDGKYQIEARGEVLLKVIAYYLLLFHII